MRFKRYIVFAFAIGVSGVLLSAQGVDWQQGAFAVAESEGEMELSKIGVAEDLHISGRLPLYLPGLLTAESSDLSRITMLGSNGVLVDFRGGGYFAVERFEQFSAFTEGWRDAREEAGQSRIIMNLRAGTLVLDQHKLSESSKLTVETPVGRLEATRRALWMVDITNDTRKRSFGFNIYCVTGTVRLTDLMGRTFTVHSGQRISGAGSANTPSIEVAEVTSDAQEYLDEFSLRASKVTAMELSDAEFKAAMQPLRSSAAVEDRAAKPRQSEAPIGKRPIVIEYEPRPRPITPFKADARALSAYEEGLF